MNDYKKSNKLFQIIESICYALLGGVGLCGGFWFILNEVMLIGILMLIVGVVYIVLLLGEYILDNPNTN